ncbi:MAG TPA: hypothetical protein VHP31_05550 [Caproicibacter sp.]|nr:hypothetical protein [Caproicibacter sp.]
MRQWWNEKDFVQIIPEKVSKEDVSLEDAVNTIIKEISLSL